MARPRSPSQKLVEARAAAAEGDAEVNIACHIPYQTHKSTKMTVPWVHHESAEVGEGVGDVRPYAAHHVQQHADASSVERGARSASLFDIVSRSPRTCEAAGRALLSGLATRRCPLTKADRLAAEIAVQASGVRVRACDGQRGPEPTGLGARARSSRIRSSSRRSSTAWTWRRRSGPKPGA